MAAFWIAYLIPLALGVTIGWWWRGIYSLARASDNTTTADQIYAREVELARQRHPAYRGERGTWFDG